MTNNRTVKYERRFATERSTEWLSSRLGRCRSKFRVSNLSFFCAIVWNQNISDNRHSTLCWRQIIYRHIVTFLFLTHFHSANRYAPIFKINFNFWNVHFTLFFNQTWSWISGIRSHIGLFQFSTFKNCFYNFFD